MHRVVAGKTGWGKSWYAQQIMAANAPEYPVFVVLDFKDEYRGLVKAGLAKWMALGPAEAELTRDDWRDVLAETPRVVIARHQLETEDWREAVAPVVGAARDLGQQSGGAFIALEEAHFIAPQQGGVPDAITGLATTGRGEQASSLWATQRPATLEETVLAQADEKVLGGFTSDADLDKISKFVDYNKEIHNPTVNHPGTVPEALLADGEPLPLRKFEEGGSTVGSEWVYSNDSGDLERRDTREVEATTTHYGPEGKEIHDP